MSLCTVCGKHTCGHTPKQRGQTHEEILRPLCKDEIVALGSGNTPRAIHVAQIHAHDPSLFDGPKTLHPITSIPD